MVFSALAGIAGGLAMAAAMRLVAGMAGERRSMLDAVGGLMTKSHDHARMIGWFLHCISAVLFGQIYVAVLLALGWFTWPSGVLGGMSGGVFHGIVMALLLVWLSDQHPLPEYRSATPAVFLTHFFGHVVYGSVVGIVLVLAHF